MMESEENRVREWKVVEHWTRKSQALDKQKPIENEKLWNVECKELSTIDK